MSESEDLMFDDNLPANHRSGYVALVGKPNVGKSTLLNAWLGFKLAPVSPKPQTTRARLLGILTQPDAQIIFVDTPGIHLPRTKLGEYMVHAAKEAIPDADVLVFMVDASEPPTRADEEIARLIHAQGHGAVILALNKIDVAPGEQYPTIRAAYEALGPFEQMVEISALNGDGCAALLDLVLARLPLGPRYYPADQVSDLQERYIAEELIREQLLLLLEQEVPHALAVVVEDFQEKPDNRLRISATIYAEKESHKGIIIGKGGAMLKRVGSQARVALEAFFERPVHVELWVKVRPHWRQDPNALREFGYGLAEKEDE